MSPNGGRVNIGAYGNTTEASRTPVSLFVQSTPITGIGIYGDKPGTTNYDATAINNQEVTLMAPYVATIGGINYDFVSWHVDGVDKTDYGLLSTLIVMDADHTALATYAIQKRTLNVGSEPPTGVEMTGTKPGTTNYSVECNHQEAVTLTAPPAVTQAGIDYHFIRWRVNGQNRTAGLRDVSITMSANTNAVAVYEIDRHTLTVRSTPTGLSIAGTRPGVTNYAVQCDDQEAVNLSAPASVKLGEQDYLFVRWTLDGTPQADGVLDISTAMDINHTVEAIYQLDVHDLAVRSTPIQSVQITGDKPGLTDYVAQCNDHQTIQLTAPATASVSGVDYRFVRWVVNSVSRPERQNQVSVTVDADGDALAIYEIQPRLLTVSSTPVIGVTITGDKPGTTTYQAECEHQTVVMLAAPETFAAGSLDYAFVCWRVDLVDQPAGVTDVEVTMDTDHTVVAVYAIVTHTLLVQSTPIPGFTITGTKPGTTEYSAQCNDESAVDLTAQAVARIAGLDYDFVRWQIDGADQPAGQLGVSVKMDAGRTLTAMYEIQPHTLTVNSTPIDGVSITGTQPGTTQYQAQCDHQANVSLTAPTLVLHEGAKYDFVRWELGGVGQGPSASVGFSIVDDTTATAVYEIQTYALTVLSSPDPGVIITGTRPGTTNYTATCGDQEQVTLTAAPAANGSYFLRWADVGGATMTWDATLSLKITADVTVVAEYDAFRDFYVNDDTPEGAFAAGNASNTGRTPSDPLRSIQGVLTRYPGIGDDATIHVSAGVFDGGFTLSSANSGLTLTGAGSDATIIDGGGNGGRIDMGAYGNTPEAPVPVPELPADVNGDCVVNILDLIAVRNNLGKTPSGDIERFDANKDGKINILDLIFVRNALGQRCE